MSELEREIIKILYPSDFEIWQEWLLSEKNKDHPDRIKLGKLVKLIEGVK